MKLWRASFFGEMIFVFPSKYLVPIHAKVMGVLGLRKLSHRPRSHETQVAGFSVYRVFVKAESIAGNGTV
ncbi:MAG: hypothetical protein IIA67_01580 [Planctomycetes bacterium]|nr:hypothetical protein [Planctomycetota bacterium]